MSVAFGVPQDGAKGTTAADMRHILDYKWANTGVVGGLECNGSSGLYYIVSKGMAVCSRGASDGKTEAFFPGGNTPAVAANATGFSRIDAVWIKAQDKTQGDASNDVVVGVVQGTPSQTPVKPQLPTGTVAIAYMLMPAGATTTHQAYKTGEVDSANQAGASLGVLVDHTDSGQGNLSRGQGKYTFIGEKFFVPTKRALSVQLNASLQAINASNHFGSAYLLYEIDDKIIKTFKLGLYDFSPMSYTFTDTTTVDAGNHTIKVSIYASAQEPASDIYFAHRDEYYDNGQRLVVVDLGMAK